MDKPKVMAPANIRKMTFRLFVNIVVKGAGLNLYIFTFISTLNPPLLFIINDEKNPKINKTITAVYINLSSDQSYLCFLLISLTLIRYIVIYDNNPAVIATIAPI